MATTKASQRAVNKYVKNNYDSLTIRVPKGQKEELKNCAIQNGESLNAFVNKAIEKAVADRLAERRTSFENYKSHVCHQKKNLSSHGQPFEK